MADDTRQEFRLDIFKLLRDQLSVSVHDDSSGHVDLNAATISGESLTRVLREQFGFDDRRLSDLGIDLAAHGRAALTLHCTQTELRAARLIPPA
jgi:hypothetical protein